LRGSLPPRKLRWQSDASIGKYEIATVAAHPRNNTSNGLSFRGALRSKATWKSHAKVAMHWNPRNEKYLD